MTLENYWTIVQKHWKLIASCFLLVGLVTFVVSKLMTPLYQSTTLVQVDIRSGNNQAADINSLLASDQLVQTETQLAVSDPVLREVASHYAGMTAEQLVGDATSAPEINTQLFAISVLNGNPARAAAVANDIAATLIKQQLQVVQQENNQSQQQIQQDLAATQQQINSTTNKIAMLQAQKAPQANISVLQGQLAGLQQHYSQWQTLLAQLELTEAQSGNFLRVAQPAQPGLSPVKPDVLFNTAAGLLGGLLLGLLFALLFEQLDMNVRTPEALTQLVGWSVLGNVWRSRTIQKNEIINPQGHDANVESYRILRTNIGFSSIDKPLHSLMVTSATPGDGKSTIAANLAIFMAKAGKNTLLVDADLRRPTLHQLFNLAPDKMGLSNAVLTFNMPMAAMPMAPQFTATNSPPLRQYGANSFKHPLEPFFHPVGIPNLRVMPSGPLPPNPSELLDSKAMLRLLEALATCDAEIIIFDSPPMRGLSDANILASKVDGTLVVVDITRAHKGHLKQVKMLLTQAGAHVVGCVVNKQRRSRNDSSYSYYYYYRHNDQNGVNVGAQNGNTLAGSADSAHGLDAAKSAVKLTLPGGKKGGRAGNGR